MPSQSPRTVQESNPHYRDAPTEPFQPPFYRSPKSDPTSHINPTFKLPSQKSGHYATKSPAMKRRPMAPMPQEQQMAPKVEEPRQEQRHEVKFASPPQQADEYDGDTEF